MSIQTVEIALPTGIDSVSVGLAEPISIVEVRQGPAGGSVINAATQSDGTADLDLLNVETVTATVSGTLTAPHIHGNLAGSVYAHIRAGETLAKGDPVYVSGSFGSGSTLIPIVSKADASNAAKMPAIGIMDADVANNNTGHMVITGTITELDTTGLTVNAELYVAAGGGMTATPPTARAQPVARVERVNANNGAVIVKVNGLSASDATGNTLVRRTSGGGASLNGLTLSGTGGSPFTSTLTGGINFANRTLVLPDVSGTLVTAETLANSATITASTAVAVDTIVLRDGAGQINITNSNVAGTTAYASTAGWTYAGSAASAHRTALGLGTGDTLQIAGLTMGTLGSLDPIIVKANNAGTFLTKLYGFNQNFFTFGYFGGRTVPGATTSSNGVYAWSNSTTSADTAVDLLLHRDAANTLAQRNGTAAQESRIYGTYSGAGADYRRLALKMSSAGVAQIVAEGAGSGSTGNVLQLPANTTFADLTATRAALGIQTKTGTSTGLDAVGVTDITGLTGYALEADTWYKLELQYLWTSTSSNFQINFVTTGTLLRGGTTPALGQSMSAAASVSTTFFVNDTTFALRGSAGESRTNLPAFGYAYFKTGTAGTGKVQLQLLAGTTLSTIVSSCAVLTKQQ